MTQESSNSMASKIQKNTPNMSAMLISGGLSVLIGDWDFLAWGMDLSQLKPVAFAALPAFALSISYGVRKLWLIKKVGATQRGILAESNKTIQRIRERLQDNTLPDKVKEMLEEELLVAMKDDIALSKASMTALKKNQEHVINGLDEKPPTPE